MARYVMTGPNTFRVEEEEDSGWGYTPPPQKEVRDAQPLPAYEPGRIRPVRSDFTAVNRFQAPLHEDYWPEREYEERLKQRDYMMHTQRDPSTGVDDGVLYGPQPPENAPPLRMLPVATLGGLVRHNAYNQYNLTPEAERMMRTTQLRMEPHDSPDGWGKASGWYTSYGDSGIPSTISLRTPPPEYLKPEYGYGAPGMASVLTHETAHNWYDKKVPWETAGQYQYQLQPDQLKKHLMGPAPAPGSEQRAAWETPYKLARQADVQRRYRVEEPESIYYQNYGSIPTESYAYGAEALTGDAPKYIPPEFQPAYSDFFRNVPKPVAPTSDHLREYAPWTPAPYGLDRGGYAG